MDLLSSDQLLLRLVENATAAILTEADVDKVRGLIGLSRTYGPLFALHSCPADLSLNHTGV